MVRNLDDLTFQLASVGASKVAFSVGLDVSGQQNACSSIRQMEHNRPPVLTLNPVSTRTSRWPKHLHPDGPEREPVAPVHSPVRNPVSFEKRSAPLVEIRLHPLPTVEDLAHGYGLEQGGKPTQVVTVRVRDDNGFQMVDAVAVQVGKDRVRRRALSPKGPRTGIH
jgi:hypothetical protein